MKNVLFWISHEISQNIFWGTELELISKHMQKGDNVIIVYGGNCINLSLFNFAGHRSNKKINEIRFNKGMKFLNFSKKSIFKLKSYKRKFNKRFSDIDQLKDFKYKDCDIGEGVASSLISSLREHNVNTIEYSYAINDMISSSIYLYDFFVDFLNKKNINLAYFFNGRLADQRPVLRAFQIHKIKFYVFEMGEKIHNYVLFENAWAHSAEYAKLKIKEYWDDSRPNKENAAKNWFLNRKEGVHGRFAFTSKQIKGFLPKSFDFSKKNIVIFNSSIDEFAAISEMKNEICKDEHLFLEKLIKDFENEESYKFYLRIHPNLSHLNNSQVKKLKKLQFSNLEIIWADSIIDSYELMQNADIVLTFGSTMGVEASFWKRPSILVGRSFYESLDCCYIPKDYEELVDLIKKSLEPKCDSGALMYAYYLLDRNLTYEKFRPNQGLFMGLNLNQLDVSDRFNIKLYKLLDKVMFKLRGR